MQIHLRSTSFLIMISSTQFLWCDRAKRIAESAYCLAGALCALNAGLATTRREICLQVSKDWRLHITLGGGESVSMLLALQGRQSISRTHAARSALADNGQLPPARQAKHPLGTRCTSLMAAGWPLLATST